MSDGFEVVEFEKSDGTLRKMIFNNSEEFVNAAGTAGSDRKFSESVERVVDVEKGAWRSFRVNSVKNRVRPDRIILTKDNCIHCKNLKEQYKRDGIQYTEVKLNEDNIDMFRNIFSDLKTVPYVIMQTK